MLKTTERVILSITILSILFLYFLSLLLLPQGRKEKVLFNIRFGTPVKKIAQELREAGLISSERLFLLSYRFFTKRIIAGEYEFSGSESLLQILRKLARGERKLYIFTIFEGANIYDVAEEVEKKGLCKKEDFLKLCFDRNFLRDAGIEADSLEGYLEPETYFFSKETDFRTFLKEIVKRRLIFFERPHIKRRMEELGLDIHKTLTLASMIEKEAKIEEEKPIISAVFHNRLKRGMRLDCDPTVIYGLKLFGTSIKRIHLMTKTPYNTYTFKGLPKGPICNPDITSIRAALYPEKVDYLFFVSRNDGTHIFTKEKKEHERYVAIYQKK